MNNMQDGMLALAEGDPRLVEEYKKMPVIEYYAILDAKIEDVKKQKNKSK